MSFGTAHHPTTSQILKLLLKEELFGKYVLDMGCGTAILAIFASKAGAEKVLAIDNDEWAYKNSIENIDLNNIQNIDIQLGDANSINSSQKFDIILANINRNILLNDISKYSESMSKGSMIFFSGFYTEDLDAIKEEAAKFSLNCLTYIVKENWVAAKFVKN
jgi:ribosomal protein L11 methyltransferase